MKHQVLTAAIALSSVALALLSGAGNRRAALVGATISGATALGSILAMGRFGRTGSKPVQSAMAVMAVFFLVRILLVAVGTIVVARAGENIFAFVIAFFVPFFVYAVVEGAYLHALGQGPIA